MSLSTEFGTSDIVQYQTVGYFPLKFAGPFSKTATIKFIKIGNTVTLTVPDIFGTSTSAALLNSQADMTNFPTDLLPSLASPSSIGIDRALNGEDNGSTNIEICMTFDSTGMFFGVTPAQNDFTSSGTCGVYSFVITYQTV